MKNGLSTNAINTLSKMGLTSSYTAVHNMIVIMDDYHDCYQTRIPTTTSSDKICHMATTLVNSSNLLAIPYFSPDNNRGLFWNNGLINAQVLKFVFNEITTEMSSSYNVYKPLWRNKVTDILTFSEKDLTDSLTAHSYDINLEVHHKRDFGNTKLIDFKESNPKNSEEYLNISSSKNNHLFLS